MRRRTKIILTVLAVVIGIPALLLVVAARWFANEGETNGTITSSGHERHYLLYVPKSYDKDKPTPLVISLHPAASRPEAERELSRWNDMADKHGFIVVYPSGRDVPRVWPMSVRDLDTDVKYISDLIDKLEGEYNIDKDRIFADGISNGGGMAFALSCKLPDRLAAVGAVASAQTLAWKQCPDSKPVPTIAFHGTADPVAYYKGSGPTAIAPTGFPPIREWVTKVAQRNHCAPQPAESKVADHVTQLVYQNCEQGADVVFYSIDGGGHTWPGGGNVYPEFIVGKTNNEINATSLMWDFYMQHPLRHEEKPVTSH